jgi:Domain of unknown function (DUF4129)
MTQPQPHRPLSVARTALAVAATGGAFLVVSLATRAGTSAPPRPPGWSAMSSAATHGATGLAIALAPVVVVAGLAVWLAGHVLARRRRAEEDARDPGARRRRRWRWVVLAATLIAATLLVHWGVVKVPKMHLPGLTQRGPAGPSAHGRSVTGHPSGVDWTLAAAVWAAMVVAAAIAIRRWRRRPPPRAAALAEVEPVPETGVDYMRLRAIDDPRAAVIATYAEMERTLARRRMPRDPAEAPREYLARILDGLRRSRAAAGRLTVLYERARFSVHTIDSAMKGHAIDSLEAVERDPGQAT